MSPCLLCWGEEIVKWRMYQVLPEYTFLKLALAVSHVDESLYSSECQCYLSHDIKLTSRVKVPLEFNVLECSEVNAIYFRYCPC